MSRATELLIEIHRIRLELERLGPNAGVRIRVVVEPLSLDTATPAPEPAAASSFRTDNSLHAGPHNDKLVLEALTKFPAGAWVSRPELADALDVTPQQVGKPLTRLVANGQVDYNGELRKHARFRLRQTASLEELKPIPAPEPAPRRVSERSGEAPHGAGTPAGRILLAVHHKPGTAHELARRLNLTHHVTRAAILELEKEGELERAGRQRDEIIYRGGRGLASAA